MKRENPEKIYVAETKMVSSFLWAGRRRNPGGEMKVSAIMLLKTNGGKMPVFELAIMLMKIKIVSALEGEEESRDHRF